jgi:hypothetical protein
LLIAIIDDYITGRYKHWLEYARHQSIVAAKGDQPEDIFNEVMLSLLAKEKSFLLFLLNQKKKNIPALIFMSYG